MALGSIKASTQDSSTGTPVAIAVNEDDATKAVQAIAPVGNKTTYGETSRTGLTTADTATTDLSTTAFAGTSGANLIDVGNALTALVRCSCGTASKTLTGRLIHYDGSNNAIGFGPTLSFASDASLRITASGDFVCQRQLQDLGSARKVRFYVDTVSGGTWAIYVRPL